MLCNAFSPELLEQYLLDKLSEEECKKLERHLPTCKACVDRLAELDGFISTIRTAFLSADTTGERTSSKGRTKAPAADIPPSVLSRYIC